MMTISWLTKAAATALHTSAKHLSISQPIVIGIASKSQERAQLVSVTNAHELGLSDIIAILGSNQRTSTSTPVLTYVFQNYTLSTTHIIIIGVLLLGVD
jgi:hypothetical protein